LPRKSVRGKRRQRTAKGKRVMVTQRLSRRQRPCRKKPVPQAPKRPHNQNSSERQRRKRKPRAKQVRGGREVPVDIRWGEFVITPALMMGMEDIILDRIVFGGVKELEEIYAK
jgi:hypothetical protein